jgi:hypothetical protein
MEAFASLAETGLRSAEKGVDRAGNPGDIR